MQRRSLARLPTVVGHQFVRGGPTLFSVQNPDGTVHWSCEIDIPAAITQELMRYKGLVSGRTWSGEPGVYYVARICSHRWYHGDLYFFVGWSGLWSHAIWQSEVPEEDVQDGPILQAYRAAHGL